MPGYWNGFQEHASFLTETIGVYPNQNNLSLKQPNHCQINLFHLALFHAYLLKYKSLKYMLNRLFSCET